MVLAWSDHATGDPATNRALRQRHDGSLRGAPGGLPHHRRLRRRLLPPPAHLVRVQRGVGRRRPRRHHPGGGRAPRHEAQAVLERRRRDPHRRRALRSSPPVSCRPLEASARSNRTRQRARRGGHRAVAVRGPPARGPTRPPRSPRERADGPPHPPLARRPAGPAGPRPGGLRRRRPPLDTLDPKGPEAQTIHNLAVPVFAIAGVVFFLVQGGVLFLAWRFRKRKDDDGEPAAADARQHPARAGLDDPARPAARRRRRRLRAHPARPRRPTRGCAAGDGHRPAVVVGVPVRHRR